MTSPASAQVEMCEMWRCSSCGATTWQRAKRCLCGGSEFVLAASPGIGTVYAVTQSDSNSFVVVEMEGGSRILAIASAGAAPAIGEIAHFAIGGDRIARIS